MDMSAFHPGEIEIQRRRGVRQEAVRVGSIIAPAIPAELAPLLALQRLAVAATVDPAGRPWASLFTGPEGFITAVDGQLLRLAGHTSLDEIVRANLGANADLGLLVLDPRTRLRLRFNGGGHLAPEGLFLLVREVYGNCRKYIQKRRIVSGSWPPPRAAFGSGSLDARQQALVAGADTLFLATWTPEGGADASHRGGRPGFVRVLDAGHIEFPDYPGNNMFNSLGNIARHPRAGLLFADFVSGDLLQITGRARLMGEGGVMLRIGIEEVRETPGGAGLRFALVEPSPANP
jgi:predicted pyridoxine 5'-phosphate oxidase superfamily flavin-nucleotide-binding protein